VAAVRHLTLRTPTLDDVFLELTGNHIQPDQANGRGPGGSAMDETTVHEVVEVGR
jgi:hypothetical protein